MPNSNGPLPGASLSTSFPCTEGHSELNTLLVGLRRTGRILRMIGGYRARCPMPMCRGLAIVHDQPQPPYRVECSRGCNAMDIGNALGCAQLVAPDGKDD